MRFLSLPGSERIDESFAMKERHSTAIHRRDLLRATMAGSAAALVADVPAGDLAAAEPKTKADKRRARYQPNSPEVQEFYLVNRYPKR
jgi:hypothetical protein